jgi:hypothetical protein
MRQYRTDYRLWPVLFWPALLVLGCLSWPPGPNNRSLWGNVWVVANHRADASDFGPIVIQFLGSIPLAFAAGWVDQALAQVCGIRLTRRPVREHAADYDDQARPAPPG